MSTIEIVWSERAGTSSKHARRFRDFVVDGVRLSTWVADQVTVFGWDSPEEQLRAVERLSGTAPPDMPSGRVSLYVCPECGDLGCGASGVFVERTSDSVVWRDFAYENNYDGLVHSPDDAPLGTSVLAFSRESYDALLENLRSDAVRDAGLTSRSEVSPRSGA